MRKRLMGISNVKLPIWALLQHLKTLQKLRDYKGQFHAWDNYTSLEINLYLMGLMVFGKSINITR